MRERVAVCGRAHAVSRMIAATRRWFRRNRTNLVVGAGVLGAGYLAGQYVLSKIQEARQRMSEERVAKEKYATPSSSISLMRWTRHNGENSMG